MGIRGEGRPLYVRSSSKRTTKSSSIIALEDLFGGLSFTCRKDTCNSTNQFVQALKTFTGRLATSFYWATWHITISLAFELFADSIGVGVIFVRLCAPWFKRIVGVFSIVKRDDRSPGRNAERSLLGNTSGYMPFILRKPRSLRESPHLRAKNVRSF